MEKMTKNKRCVYIYILNGIDKYNIHVQINANIFKLQHTNYTTKEWHS